MADHVIILGAGASAKYKAPLMKDFLDRAEDLYWSHKIPEDSRPSFARVFAAMSTLKRAHSNAQLELRNIEAVFTAIEMSEMLGIQLLSDAKDNAKLVDDVRTLIVTTLEEAIAIQNTFRIAGSTPEGPQEIVDFLRAVFPDAGTQAKLRHSVAIITFNYDLIIDTCLYICGFPIDYALSSIPTPNAVCLLKLHGSLNWTLSDDSTPRAVSVPVQNCILVSKKFAVNNPSFTVRATGKLAQVNLDGETVRCKGQALIVPPSWNKTGSHGPLASVWKRAAKELSDAHSIYIVGYSLPNTDVFFRQLYALGTIGETMLRQLLVFNLDDTREDVFKEMAGPGAMRAFKFEKKSFTDALPMIRSQVTSHPRRALPKEKPTPQD